MTRPERSHPARIVWYSQEGPPWLTEYAHIPAPRKPTPHQGHGKRNCVKILERLSAYLDDELSGDICLEIRTHLGIARIAKCSSIRCDTPYNSVSTDRPPHFPPKTVRRSGARF